MLRSFLFLSTMFVAAIFFGIFGAPALLKREWSLAVSKMWARISLGALKLFCGIDDRIEGEDNLPPGAAIIAAKHQSMWETLRLTVLLPRPSFVLKKELERWPVFSWFCRANGFIFVDRKGGATALRDMIAKARVETARGSQIVIFPEGTRVPPGERVPLQPGIAALSRALSLPVVPVTHDSGAHWVQPGPIKVPGTITMRIFPPLGEGLDRKRIMSALEHALSETPGDHAHG
ncbi:MAG: lysophospholipid acyltransferase family protein [Parvularcula sp.]|jgi:1-acyl-sn-glycerol-3-phosphate acyltransferase|nr:lysophospholipid acyltransferase family protein [Parvularcula sp.]